MHKAVRNVTRLLERIQDYEKRIVKRRGQLDREDFEALLEALDAAGPGACAVRPAHRRGAADRPRPGCLCRISGTRRDAVRSQWPGIIDRYVRICYTPPLMIRRISTESAEGDSRRPAACLR